MRKEMEADICELIDIFDLEIESQLQSLCASNTSC